MKSATFGEGNGPDEESYGGDEGEYEEGKSNRGSSPPNGFPFHGFHQ